MQTLLPIWFVRALISACRFACGILLGLMFLAKPLNAQEAFRVSLAGQEAAEMKKRSLANQRFNLKLGPVALRMQAGMQVEANDNIRVTSQNKQEDIILRPQVNTFAAWQITEKNLLSMSLGLGYIKYVSHSEFDSLFLAPGSDIGFDLYIKDVVINFHDRFSYSQDITGDPTISGVGPIERFENVSGILVTWDLNKAVITAGYDHAIYEATQSEFSYQSRASELFNASVAFELNPVTFAGVQVGGGFTDFDENVLNDSRHIAAGPFFSCRISEYSQIRVSGGYVIYSFDDNATTPSEENVSGVFADLAFQQRVNEALSHSISAGRQFQSGLFSDAVDLIYVRHSAQWHVFQKTSLSTSLSYEHVNQSGGIAEEADRYGVGLTIGRAWNEHLNSSLTYQFFFKASDEDERDYTQNRLVLDVFYTF